MSYIVRRNKAMGEKSLPIITEMTGLPVYESGSVLPNTDDFVFRWGTTCTVPGGQVVNSAKAISKTSDKRGFRLELAKNDLTMPSWGSLEEMLLNDAHKTVQEFLLRPAVHTRSEDMFLCTELSEVVKSIQKINGPYYVSKFIKKKNEYRVFVAQNRIVWMIRKHPKKAEDITWGCVEQGNFEYIGWTEWNSEVTRLGLASMKLSGLDFGAIDIVEDQDGNFYVLEVNTAPWLSPYYSKCVGKVFGYILKNGKKHFEDTENLYWKNVIHPAIGG